MQGIKKTKKQGLSAQEKELFEIILPKLSVGANITLLRDESATFGPSKKGDELCIEATNGKSAKLLSFETDGEYRDGPVVNYSDGYMRYRKVSSWTWIFIENLTRDSDSGSRVSQTCYLKSEPLSLALRAAIGSV